MKRDELLKSAAGLLAAVALCASTAGTARAQTGQPDYHYPLSVSTEVIEPSAHVSGSITQPEISDAILAQSLRDMHEVMDQHFHKGEYNHIINMSRVLVQGDPADLNSYQDSAWLLWSTDHNPEAIAFLQQGLKANPNTFSMYDELGTHYSTLMKDYRTALPYLQKAVTFTCPYTTWHTLAHCYEHTNQWDKAVSAWQAAAKYPDDRLAPARLVRARAELAKTRATSHT